MTTAKNTTTKNTTAKAKLPSKNTKPTKTKIEDALRNDTKALATVLESIGVKVSHQKTKKGALVATRVYGTFSELPALVKEIEDPEGKKLANAAFALLKKFRPMATKRGNKQADFYTFTVWSSGNSLVVSVSHKAHKILK